MNDLDEHYRRVSALDPGRPSEAARRAVLAHAAGLIAAPRARRRRRALWAAFAAAGLAGFLVIPQLLPPRSFDHPAAPSATAAKTSVPVAAPAPATAPAAAPIPTSRIGTA